MSRLMAGWVIPRESAPALIPLCSIAARKASIIRWVTFRLVMGSSPAHAGRAGRLQGRPG
ncbi:hypothetical protein ALDI51_20400 [Alicycliphilus denitrificans]|nr:hypothetical protein ALDI51_20400 [Alicycliphilus denitrificans]